MTLDKTMMNPQKLGAIAHLVHALLLGDPNPEAAYPHFLFLLVSLWLDAYPQME
jgi:hypothetical protein